MMQLATEITTFTCICCPLGCQLEVSFDEQGSVAEVSGNTCGRGAAYAEREAAAPERMVTAVLPVEGCLEPVSVKTASPVPKARVADVLAACPLRRYSFASITFEKTGGSALLSTNRNVVSFIVHHLRTVVLLQDTVYHFFCWNATSFFVFFRNR